MPWFRVDDRFHSHPKVLALSWAARGLWVTAGSWCGDHSTDGVVPLHALRTWGAPRKLVDELVAVGLWEALDDGTGWCFHDWASQQPTRAQTEASRAAAAERKRKSRGVTTTPVTPDVTRDRRARHDGRPPGVTRPVTPPVTVGVTPPRPDPTLPDPTDGGQNARARAPAPDPLRPEPDPPPGSAAKPDASSPAKDRAPPVGSGIEPWLVVAKAYGDRYAAARKLDYAQHAAHHRDHDRIAVACESIARSRGMPLEAVVGTVLDRAFADPWHVEHDFPPAAIAKQVGRLFEPPARRGAMQPVAPNTPALSPEDEAAQLDAIFGPEPPERPPPSHRSPSR